MKKAIRTMIEMILLAGMVFMFCPEVSRAEVAEEEDQEEEYVFDRSFYNYFESVPETIEEEEWLWESMGNDPIHFVEGNYLCEKLSSNPKEAAISFIRNVEGEVRIPSVLNGYKIRGVGVNADTLNQEDVAVSYGVVFMPSIAQKVTKVILPEGVEYISEYAFANCRSLKEFVIPSTLKRMYYSLGDTAIEELTFPAGMEILHLGYMYNLKTITFLGDCPLGEEVGFGNLVIETLELPEGVTRFTDNMVAECNRLTEVVLPESVGGIYLGERIPEKLKYITIPNAECDYNIWYRIDRETGETIYPDLSNLTLIVPGNSNLLTIPDTYGINFEIMEGTEIPEPKEQRYVIKQGDTLWKISREYGCTVQDLTKRNRIKNKNLIFAGQELWIPVVDKER